VTFEALIDNARTKSPVLWEEVVPLYSHLVVSLLFLFSCRPPAGGSVHIVFVSGAC
jgi:hypothetical protein